MTDPNLKAIAGSSTFTALPPVVGYWVFPGSPKAAATKFGMAGKPNWFHRTMMRLVLGFRWEDKT